MPPKDPQALRMVRFDSLLADLLLAPPLSKAMKAMSDVEIERRVLGHSKSTGNGYQTRISSVLASYVDATKKKVG